MDGKSIKWLSVNHHIHYHTLDIQHEGKLYPPNRATVSNSQLLTKEDSSAYTQATINGGLRGLAIGTGIAVPGHFALMRYSHNYKALPIPLKAFGAVVVILPCLSISAEKAGEAYERSQWSGIGKRELDMKEKRESERLAGLSTQARLNDWAGRNRYGIIAGGWVFLLSDRLRQKG
jgi:hypothetical protein